MQPLAHMQKLDSTDLTGKQKEHQQTFFSIANSTKNFELLGARFAQISMQSLQVVYDHQKKKRLQFVHDFILYSKNCIKVFGVYLESPLVRPSAPLKHHTDSQQSIAQIPGENPPIITNAHLLQQQQLQQPGSQHIKTIGLMLQHQFQIEGRLLDIKLITHEGVQYLLLALERGRLSVCSIDWENKCLQTHSIHQFATSQTLHRIEFRDLPAQQKEVLKVDPYNNVVACCFFQKVMILLFNSSKIKDKDLKNSLLNIRLDQGDSQVYQNRIFGPTLYLDLNLDLGVSNIVDYDFSYDKAFAEQKMFFLSRVIEDPQPVSAGNNQNNISLSQVPGSMDIEQQQQPMQSQTTFNVQQNIPQYDVNIYTKLSYINFSWLLMLKKGNAASSLVKLVEESSNIRYNVQAQQMQRQTAVQQLMLPKDCYKVFCLNYGSVLVFSRNFIFCVDQSPLCRHMALQLEPMKSYGNELKRVEFKRLEQCFQLIENPQVISGGIKDAKIEIIDDIRIAICLNKNFYILFLYYQIVDQHRLIVNLLLAKQKFHLPQYLQTICFLQYDVEDEEDYDQDEDEGDGGNQEGNQIMRSVSTAMTTGVVRRDIRWQQNQLQQNSQLYRNYFFFGNKYLESQLCLLEQLPISAVGVDGGNSTEGKKKIKTSGEETIFSKLTNYELKVLVKFENMNSILDIAGSVDNYYCAVGSENYNKLVHCYREVQMTQIRELEKRFQSLLLLKDSSNITLFNLDNKELVISQEEANRTNTALFDGKVFSFQQLQQQYLQQQQLTQPPPPPPNQQQQQQQQPQFLPTMPTVTAGCVPSIGNTHFIQTQKTVQLLHGSVAWRCGNNGKLKEQRILVQVCRNTVRVMEYMNYQNRADKEFDEEVLHAVLVQNILILKCRQYCYQLSIYFEEEITRRQIVLGQLESFRVCQFSTKVVNFCAFEFPLSKKRVLQLQQQQLQQSPGLLATLYEDDYFEIYEPVFADDFEFQEWHILFKAGNLRQGLPFINNELSNVQEGNVGGVKNYIQGITDCSHKFSYKYKLKNKILELFLAALGRGLILVLRSDDESLFIYQGILQKAGGGGNDLFPYDLVRVILPINKYHKHYHQFKSSSSGGTNNGVNNNGTINETNKVINSEIINQNNDGNFNGACSDPLQQQQQQDFLEPPKQQQDCQEQASQVQQQQNLSDLQLQQDSQQQLQQEDSMQPLLEKDFQQLMQQQLQEEVINQQQQQKDDQLQQKQQEAWQQLSPQQLNPPQLAQQAPLDSMAQYKLSLAAQLSSSVMEEQIIYAQGEEPQYQQCCFLVKEFIKDTPFIIVFPVTSENRSQPLCIFCNRRNEIFIHNFGFSVEKFQNACMIGEYLIVISKTTSQEGLEYYPPQCFQQQEGIPTHVRINLYSFNPKFKHLMFYSHVINQSIMLGDQQPRFIETMQTSKNKYLLALLTNKNIQKHEMQVYSFENMESKSKFQFSQQEVIYKIRVFDLFIKGKLVYYIGALILQQQKNGAGITGANKQDDLQQQQHQCKFFIFQFDDSKEDESSWLFKLEGLDNQQQDLDVVADFTILNIGGGGSVGTELQRDDSLLRFVLIDNFSISVFKMNSQNRFEKCKNVQFAQFFDKLLVTSVRSWKKKNFFICGDITRGLQFFIYKEQEGSMLQLAAEETTRMMVRDFVIFPYQNYLLTLVCDENRNLYIYSFGKGVTLNEKHPVDKIADFHLGTKINKLIYDEQVGVIMAAGADGNVYTIKLVQDEGMLMLKLQTEFIEEMPFSAGLNPAEIRSINVSKSDNRMKPRRAYIDTNLLDYYFNLDRQLQDEIMNKFRTQKKEIFALIEHVIIKGSNQQ